MSIEVNMIATLKSACQDMSNSLGRALNAPDIDSMRSAIRGVLPSNANVVSQTRFLAQRGSRVARQMESMVINNTNLLNGALGFKDYEKMRSQLKTVQSMLNRILGNLQSMYGEAQGPLKFFRNRVFR
jgi:hypothetical protein